MVALTLQHDEFISHLIGESGKGGVPHMRFSERDGLLYVWDTTDPDVGPMWSEEEYSLIDPIIALYEGSLKANPVLDSTGDGEYDAFYDRLAEAVKERGLTFEEIGTLIIDGSQHNSNSPNSWYGQAYDLIASGRLEWGSVDGERIAIVRPDDADGLDEDMTLQEYLVEELRRADEPTANWQLDDIIAQYMRALNEMTS